MFSIFWRPVFSKARIRQSCTLFGRQVSEAYNRTGLTFLLNRGSLSQREKFCNLHTGFSLLNAPEACSMWHDISFSVDPVFITVLPRYLNYRTCSMSWLLHLRCKGESGAPIIFSAVLILSPISWPLSFTASSYSCRLY